MEPSPPSPSPQPIGYADSLEANKPILAWSGMVPTTVLIAIQVIYGWPEALVRATAPELAISYLVGGVVGGLLFSFSIAWIVYRVGRGSQLAATLAFSIMMAVICLNAVARSRVAQSPDPEVPQPPAASAKTLHLAVAANGLVHPDHPVVLMVPDAWERPTGLAAPILLAAVEPGTGNSLGLLGFKIADKKFTLN